MSGKSNATKKAAEEARAMAQNYWTKAIREAAKLAGLIGRGLGAAETETVRARMLETVIERAYGSPKLPADAEQGIGEVSEALRALMQGNDTKARHCVGIDDE
jgi:hypothetical protein